MPLHVEDDGRLRIVTLSQPDRRNALTRDVLDALADALPTSAPADHQPIRALVLRGDPAGEAFSSGFDIAEIGPEELARGLDPIDAAATALENAPVPVFAALDGDTYGGAWELAMACDVRVARAGIRLCMPPVRLGVVYSERGLARFLRAARLGALQRIFLSADVIFADEAHALGLVDRCVHEGSAEEEARRLAMRVCESAPLAVAGIRAALRALAPSPPLSGEVARALRERREEALQSADLREGVRAFLEKRAPHFRGR